MLLAAVAYALDLREFSGLHVYAQDRVDPHLTAFAIARNRLIRREEYPRIVGACPVHARCMERASARRPERIDARPPTPARRFFL
ncbi:MAG TPA: hypothetical protein PKA33_03870 [Amaricoccus sp.]|uniref:hypothetical protein n=1 Tax=Amaricoccus sp. TaxID=1872485 RepID=UPI002CDA3829|nr:hypothetical protein [Amaricoccus sp.]HMQ92152.1 hypothetical protein [Amaricoccus sp.]HMR51515.1 hypothetical protein [Amaricoccus sp.]HMT98491.1 hypothetical protein [Amaricoccus sp.]